MKTTVTLLLFISLAQLGSAQTTVPKFDVFELDFPYSPVGIGNVWEEVDVRVTFTSPTNKAMSVGGFYFSANLWKARFAPNEIGPWTWSAQIIDKNGTTQRNGSFVCVASNNKGFIRKHPSNPFRWIYEADSSLYNGLGFGDCMSSDSLRSIYGNWGFDGGVRMKSGHGESPAWSQPFETYLTAYGEVAGMNLLRISDGNCAFTIKKIIDPRGNQYNEIMSRRADTICMAFRKHDFRIFYDIGGWNPPYIKNSADTAKMNAVLRWATYCVNRWSAYVDFWEVMNETSGADELWYTIVANHIRNIDPYRHLVSTSWEQPTHPAIDIISPHWYGTEAVTASDLETANRIKNFKQYNKPIMYGEQGNSNLNWDATSALRMRGRIWSAFFNEGILIFWNSSYARDNGGGAANIYLGAEERQYTKAHQTFTAQLDKDVRPVQVTVQGSGIRAYGLRSQKTFAVYLRSGSSISAVNRNISVIVDAPVSGIATWYNVSNGETISSQPITAGTHTLVAPDFICDIAFLIGKPIPQVPDYFPVAIASRDIGFDSLFVGSSKDIVTTMKNVGKNTVTIQSLGVSGTSAQMYSASSNPLPFSLSQNDSVTLRIRYTPTTSAIHTAHIIVNHSGSLIPEFIAVKGKGILATRISEPTLPTSLTLLRNYPNPFTERTTIVIPSYAGKDGREEFSLKVFDLFGRELPELSHTVNEHSEIVIHRAQLPMPGMYFYQIIVGTETQTGKMLLVH